MQLDIDVSGEDILKPNYTICIANKDVIVGYKLEKSLIDTLTAKFRQKQYRYNNSNKQNTLFKVRLYSIIIYKLLQTIKTPSYELTICRDFHGNEPKIKDNLNFFIKQLLQKNISYEFRRLDKDSYAHRYAYVMRKDSANKLPFYHTITLEEIETFLIKK